MPTRVRLGGYSAWIKVEGQAIEHYAIEVNEGKKEATCWIASEQTKRFSVFARKSHALHDCAAFPFLDGLPVDGIVLCKDSVKGFGVSNTITGVQTVRPFLFSSLESTDDDAFLHSTSTLNAIGEVKLIFRRITIGGRSKDVPSNQILEQQKVHESSKKALDHCITFGNEIKIPPPVKLIYKACEIVATFIFRYRSIEMLQANGPAPRAQPAIGTQRYGSDTSSSECSRSEREAKEECEEEADDLEDGEERREAKLLAEVARIRSSRKARTQEKRPKKKVKSESKPVFMPGEVIDLT